MKGKRRQASFLYHSTTFGSHGFTGTYASLVNGVPTPLLAKTLGDLVTASDITEDGTVVGQETLVSTNEVGNPIRTDTGIETWSLSGTNMVAGDTDYTYGGWSITGAFSPGGPTGFGAEIANALDGRQQANFGDSYSVTGGGDMLATLYGGSFIDDAHDIWSVAVTWNDDGLGYFDGGKNGVEMGHGTRPASGHSGQGASGTPWPDGVEVQAVDATPQGKALLANYDPTHMTQSGSVLNWAPTSYVLEEGTNQTTLSSGMRATGLNQAGMALGTTTNYAQGLWWDKVNGVHANAFAGGIPTRMNAMTNAVNGTNYFAYQATGGNFLWEMNPTTNLAGATFKPPVALDNSVATNSGWSGILAKYINDGGAIVGTATYTQSGNNTNITNGQHGVILAPAYEIQVDGFIPQEYVPDPYPFSSLYFAGDTRKSPLDGIFTSGTAIFNKYLGYTARQKVMATVYAEFDPDGSQEKEESNNNPTSIIHLTKEYNSTQFTTTPAGVSPSDGTAHILPGAVPINTATATPQSATVTVTHPSSRVVQAEFQCTVSDPLVWGSTFAALYYDITVKIDATTNPPTYTLSGNHKLFPAYEVYINKQLVHDYSPIIGGYTPFELSYPDSTAPSLSASSITSGCATMPGLTGNITQP